MEIEDKLLIIETYRNSNEYKGFQIIDITENLTKEKVEELVKNWNNNKERDTNLEVQTNPLLISLCKDIQASVTRETFLNRLQDICNNISEYSRELSFESSELRDLLDDDKNEASNLL